MFGNSSYSEAPYSAEGIDPNAEIVPTGASATGVVGTVSFILDQNLFIGHKFSGNYLDCGYLKRYIKSGIEISKLWKFVS